MGIVYIITNSITNKSYIGQTSQTLLARWKQHCYDAKKRNSQLLLARAIRKYGTEAFKIDTLEETSDCHSREKYWIKELNTFEQGYNLTLGGDGGSGHVVTPEVRKKMSDAKRGIPFSKEHKENLSLSRKGRTSWNKGIAKNNNPLTGKPRSLEVCKKISESKYRKIAQLTVNGDFIRYFLSIDSAAKTTGCCSQNISKVCCGKRKKAGGFGWKYAEEYNV